MMKSLYYLCTILGKEPFSFGIDPGHSCKTTSEALRHKVGTGSKSAPRPSSRAPTRLRTKTISEMTVEEIEATLLEDKSLESPFNVKYELQSVLGRFVLLYCS